MNTIISILFITFVAYTILKKKSIKAEMFFDDIEAKVKSRAKKLNKKIKSYKRK